MTTLTREEVWNIWRYHPAAVGSAPALVSLDMGEFLSMSIPERGLLLSPVLPVQGIGILYAPRGIGKTFVALSVAVAVASGGAVFDWRAPTPKRTLYVDGEMPATAMQSRLAALISGMAVPPDAPLAPPVRGPRWARR